MDFEQYLAQSLDYLPDSIVKEAMLYSLLNGGKRTRPQLLFEVLQGYDVPKELGYACGAGIEMIHTYSLIHDDLPAMDNDTLRRGKPTCHIAFNEATAILAGDGLLTHAFHQCAIASDDAKKNMSLMEAFVHYAGCDGMILGQIYDLAGEKQDVMDIQDLNRIHSYKTGKLLTLPFICAAILADHTADIPAWIEIGKKIGLSFQIQDDLFDVTSTAEELGKDVNSDAENQKSTYATIMGLADAEKLYIDIYEEAKELIKGLKLTSSGLENLLENLRERKK